jgi:hypothetical protein
MPVKATTGTARVNVIANTFSPKRSIKMPMHSP